MDRGPPGHLAALANERSGVGTRPGMVRLSVFPADPRGPAGRPACAFRSALCAHSCSLPGSGWTQPRGFAGRGRWCRPDGLGFVQLPKGLPLPARLALMGFVSKMPLRRRPACASTPCSLPTPPGGVSSVLDMRSSRLSPLGTLRLRREHSAPECQSGARSTLAVSHDFGGLLRTRGAGLLHPAADHGVRLVASTLRRSRVRAVLLDRSPTTEHRPVPPPESPPSLEVREVDSPPPERWGWSVSRAAGPKPCRRQATAWCPSPVSGLPVLDPERRQPIRRPAAEHPAGTAGRNPRAAPTDIRGSHRRGDTSRSRCGVPLLSFSRALLAGAVTLRSLPLVHSRTASPRPPAFSTLRSSSELFEVPT